MSIELNENHAFYRSARCVQARYMLHSFVRPFVHLFVTIVHCIKMTKRVNVESNGYNNYGTVIIV